MEDPDETRGPFQQELDTLIAALLEFNETAPEPLADNLLARARALRELPEEEIEALTECAARLKTVVCG